MQTQMDLFGNEVPVEIAYDGSQKIALKSRWRLMYGYKGDETCGHCKYCHETRMGVKRRYKCILMGMSDTADTDIFERDPACKRFEDYL